MELFITEHGGALRSAVIGIIVLGIMITAFEYLYKVMPAYDTSVELDNSGFKEIILENSPVITGEEVIYVDYQSNFDIKEWVNAKDFDGTEITDKVTIEGYVNTKKRGLYTIFARVVGNKGYTTKKKINVLVE